MASLLSALGVAPRGSDASRAALATMLALLALASWGVLWLWSASPYSRYAAHGGWLEPAAFAAVCRSLPGGDVVLPAMLHALAWVLMIAAMMLPTTYPVLGIFSTITRGRPDAARLVAALLSGFLVAWLVFGLLAHGADAMLTWIGGRAPRFSEYGWLIGMGVLAGAGLFQFSALKYRCLDQCHTPFAFVASRWRGKTPTREAFRIGLDHGVFCVGCCWALMLCMFAVGMGNLGWMLGLGVLMALEKNLPGGKRLRVPIGAALMAAAGWVLATHG